MSEILVEIICAVIELLGEAVYDSVSNSSKESRKNNKDETWMREEEPWEVSSELIQSYEKRSNTNSIEPSHIITPTNIVADAPKVKPLKTSSSITKPKKVDGFSKTDEHKIDNRKNSHLFNINKAKLEILLLSYIYTEDDGRLSYSEKSKIKNHFKSFKNKLNTEDLESVKDLMNIEPSLNNIRSHVTQNDMDDKEVDFILDTIQDFCGLNKDYKRILNRVKKSINNSINY